MLNKRKALIGWLVYTVGKPFAKRALKSKAKGAVPGRKPGSRRPNLAAILASVEAIINPMPAQKAAA